MTLLGKGPTAELHHWPVLCYSKHQVLLLPANLGGQQDVELQKNGKNMFKSAQCLNQDVTYCLTKGHHCLAMIQGWPGASDLIVCSLDSHPWTESVSKPGDSSTSSLFQDSSLSLREESSCASAVVFPISMGLDHLSSG